MHSKGIKHCVEGGGFSKVPKFCRSQKEALKDGGPAKTAAAAEVKPPRPKSNRRVKRQRTRKRPSEPPQTAVRAAEGARDWSGNERPTERRRGAKRAALPRGDGAGGRELQRKARRPACGARARKKIRKEKNRRKTPAALENMGLEPTAY